MGPSAPAREQPGDSEKVLVESPAGMGQRGSPPLDQELDDPAILDRGHVTSYTRDVARESTLSAEPSAEDMRFRFASGRICLNLCATVGERWRRGFDRLRTPNDLAHWYMETGVVFPVKITGTDLDKAREVREAIYRSAKSVLDGRRPAVADEATINRAARVPPPVPQMRHGAGSLTPARSHGAASALSAVARDAIDLLTGPEASRLRECASPECGLLFIDRSRPGRRRWCSSDACGGKARSAAYRRRTKTAASH